MHICQVANPVPRVVHPDWLHKKVREKEDKFRQRKLVDIFSKKGDGGKISDDPHTKDHSKDGHNINDMEDIMNIEKSQTRPQPIVRSYKSSKEQRQAETSDLMDSMDQNNLDGSALKNSKNSLQKVPEENIDRNVDYQGWLELRKRKWKETREKRKRKRCSFLFLLDLREFNKRNR